jgi:hypothetical protein
VRLASIATPDGPRLHVRARSGYVDAAEATGNPRLSSLQYLLESGPSAMDALRLLQDAEGRPAARRTSRRPCRPRGASCAWA